MPPNIDAYRDLVAESKRTGWPRWYHDDLTVSDCRVLYCTNAPARFGWVLREGGTHLITPSPRAEAERAVMAVVRAYDMTRAHFYWYNGATLVRLTGPDQLITRLEAAHAQSSHPAAR